MFGHGFVARTVPLVVLSALFVRGASSDEPEASESSRRTPHHVIYRTQSKITIDGKLDEPVWKNAESVGEFVFGYLEKKTGSEEQTVFKMLWDDHYLYFAAVCEDRSLMSKHTERDSKIPADDSVEIYITPNAQRPDRHFAFYINIHGALYDVQFDRNKRSVERKNFPGAPTKGKKSSWDAKGVKIATTMTGTLNDNADTDQSWTTEIAIPFENFKAAAPHTPPKPNDTWRLNPNRHAYNADGSCHYSQWAPTIEKVESFWGPKYFGWVTFSGDAQK